MLLVNNQFEQRFSSALELRQRLQRGELTAVAVTEYFLHRISDLNPHLGALNLVAGEFALQRAHELDTARRSDPHRPLPPLWGMPLAHKDLVDVRGLATSYGSRAFGLEPATQDDPLVSRLHLAGAVTLGKTQVPEFGLCGYSANLIAPPARNPRSLTHTAGGSSGGAAAAVAAGLLPFAPGSDAGGSIRLPAAACGVVGFKPANRQNLRCAPPAIELSVHGPLACSVDDAEFLDAVMRGLPLPAGVGTAGKRTVSAAANRAAAGHTAAGITRVQSSSRRRSLRIGITTSSPFERDLDIRVAPEVFAALKRVETVLADLGHLPEVTELQYQPGYFRAFSDFWLYRFSRSGFTSRQLAKFTPYSLHCYLAGAALNAQTFAQQAAKLQLLGRQAAGLWRSFEVLITPVLNVAPPPVGFYEELAVADNFRVQCETMPYTSIVNVAGWAALALPVPGINYCFSDSSPARTLDRGREAAHEGALRGACAAIPKGVPPAIVSGGSPVGVQLLAPPGQEALLWALGKELAAALQ